MKDGDNKFTETENKIRKKWLFWSIQLPAFVAGGIIIADLLGAVMDTNFMAIIIMLILSLFLFGAFYISYHCAYKNPGTILLLFEMIWIPFNFIRRYLTIENYSLKNVLVLVLVSLFLVIVFYYSYKLREINKEMQERNVKASPSYINAISVFSTATSLEELDEQFSKLNASYDSASMTVGLAVAYSHEKKRLNHAK